MAVLGSTDKGLGRYDLTIDHDPTSVSTNAPKGSIAHYVTNNSLWYKLDDGETTNWVKTREGCNICADNFCYFMCSFQDNNPYYTISSGPNPSWETVLAFIYSGSDNHAISESKILVSRYGGTGTAYLRIYDVTNSNTVAEFNWVSESLQILTDSSLTNVPTDEAIFEIQGYETGSSIYLWSFKIG